MQAYRLDIIFHLCNIIFYIRIYPLHTREFKKSHQLTLITRTIYYILVCIVNNGIKYNSLAVIDDSLIFLALTNPLESKE